MCENQNSVNKETRENNEKNSEYFNLSDIGIDLSNITDEQREEATAVYEKQQTKFSRDPAYLGHTDLIKHEIDLTDEMPYKEPFRRISLALYQELRDCKESGCRCHTALAESIFLKRSSGMEKGRKYKTMHRLPKAESTHHK